MMRSDKWAVVLSQYLGEVARTPFAYGRNDCALFAAGAVKAMTGVDPAAAWRGRYRTLRGGLRILRADGHDDHIAAAAALLPEVAVAMAQPGDLAVVPTPDGLALGVVQGRAIYVLRPDGLGLVDLLSATRAFRV